MNATLETNQLRQLDQQHHLHPFTDFRDYAANGGRIVSRAEHIYIYDSDGNKIQDAMSGLWCCSLGYSQDGIKKAVADQLMELPFYNNFFKCSNQPAVELATRLCDMAPANFIRCSSQTQDLRQTTRRSNLCTGITSCSVSRVSG